MASASGVEAKSGSVPVFTALFPTNYALYFGSNDEAAASPEWGGVFPRFPVVAVPAEILNDVADALGRYPRIPREI